MAAFLDRFGYDIFISYAWSGNIDTDSGDKGWVSGLKNLLEEELSLKLNAPVSIFLDTQTARNGNADSEIGDAIRNSALFLAVVTPAFCDARCYCRKEVEWFAADARPISSRPVPSAQADLAKRFFKVVSRPVHREQMPGAIQDNFTYELYEGDPGADLQGSTLLPITAIEQLLKSRISQNYFKLAGKLAGYLYECKQMQGSFPFPASVPEQAIAALQRAIREWRG